MAHLVPEGKVVAKFAPNHEIGFFARTVDPEGLLKCPLAVVRGATLRAPTLTNTSGVSGESDLQCARECWSNGLRIFTRDAENRRCLCSTPESVDVEGVMFSKARYWSVGYVMEKAEPSIVA